MFLVLQYTRVVLTANEGLTQGPAGALMVGQSRQLGQVELMMEPS